MKDLESFIPQKISTKPGVDFWELRLEERLTTIVHFKGATPLQIGESLDRGGNCRAMARGGWGFATFNDPRNLTRSLRQAQELARAVGKRPHKWRSREAIRTEICARPKIDPRTVSLRKKVARIKGIRERLEEHRLVDTAIIGYSDTCFIRIYLNSEDSFIKERGVSTKCFINGANTGKGGFEASSRSAHKRGVGYELVDEFEQDIPQILKDLKHLLKAEPAKGGTYTVIIDPMLAGVFAHESFGHTSEGDYIQRDPRIMEIMRLGRKIASPQLSIYDHGAMPHQCGSSGYDDEGTPCTKTALITEGILTGHLHSRETAYNMGEEPTGNARALSYAFPPIVRMTNTYIAPGPNKLRELIADVKQGILACGSRGGTGGEMFNFPAVYGILIEGGRLTKPIKNFSLSGNLFKTLKNIVALSDDFQLRGSWLGCGKMEQMPLPVATGGPHVLIKDIIVGGR